MKPQTKLGAWGQATEGREFVETGEYRRPKAGEFYASGAKTTRIRACVFVAPTALDAKYQIMTEVKA